MEAAGGKPRDALLLPGSSPTGRPEIEELVTVEELRIRTGERRVECLAEGAERSSADSSAA